MGLMVSNPWNGGTGGGSEGGTTIIQGAQNYAVDTIPQRNALIDVVEGSVCYVINASADTNVGIGGASYIFKSNAWVITSKGFPSVTDIQTTDEKQFISKDEKDLIELNKINISSINNRITEVESSIKIVESPTPPTSTNVIWDDNTL